ncbi:MAG: exodeoxyribonuclease VII small subunit [bacterium]|nr:exodeoxyribonuclease VII small subunit [bacterium]
MAKKSFEQAMKQLEQIVQDLESGDIPLEKAIKKFEEGIQLSKFCTEKLDESEKKITILMQGSDGKLAEVPFSGENDDLAEDDETG